MKALQSRFHKMAPYHIRNVMKNLNYIANIPVNRKMPQNSK